MGRGNPVAFISSIGDNGFREIAIVSSTDIRRSKCISVPRTYFQKDKAQTLKNRFFASWSCQIQAANCQSGSKVSELSRNRTLNEDFQ